MTPLRIVEINGSKVRCQQGGGRSSWEFRLPSARAGYADAQIDDYGGKRRANYPWRRGTRFSVEACFSADWTEMVGTAGFGFWNAPFGPGTRPLPALPQAVWYFFGSRRNNLPFAPAGEVGNGWFAATMDAGSPRALVAAPLTPLVLLVNQIRALHRFVWPPIRTALRMSYRQLPQRMDEWHQYDLGWRREGCFFRVDGAPVLETRHSPRGPLGFVAWIDNQYLVATPTGRFRWGTERAERSQAMTLRNLRWDRLPEH